MNTNSHAKNVTTERWFVSILTIWGTAVFATGYFGILSNINTNWVPLLVMAGITIPVLVYYLSEDFRSYIWSIDLKHLTIYHVWRIVAALIFFHYGSQNLLPAQFTIDAGFGDLAVGLLVPLVLLLRESRSKYLVFHLFGMLDFAIAVGTGFTFNVLLNDPLMKNIMTYPIVLIPLYGVCITGALSIMTLDRLLRSKSFSKLKD
ncbi:MAG: hypothetical protein N4J56_005401 [Chroococcidiopsis sp. SAG 2025]|uniref:hypothetical protein n=1 Tax=Chroococcidiopsis sp. SAG 2025 TaxID=171389 RepID=UPI002937108E|nr:hypothetical protein [Chroococcidiopsis sp. SAG 2025]MDV2995747.1 hypothetical protein [Chroococcidiopsis sp. SAG 2025]